MRSKDIPATARIALALAMTASTVALDPMPADAAYSRERPVNVANLNRVFYEGDEADMGADGQNDPETIPGPASGDEANISLARAAGSLAAGVGCAAALSIGAAALIKRSQARGSENNTT